MTASVKIGIKGSDTIILNKAAFCALVRHLLLSDGASSRFCKHGVRGLSFRPQRPSPHGRPLQQSLLSLELRFWVGRVVLLAVPLDAKSYFQAVAIINRPSYAHLSAFLNASYGRLPEVTVCGQRKCTTCCDHSSVVLQL